MADPVPAGSDVTALDDHQLLNAYQAARDRWDPSQPPRDQHQVWEEVLLLADELARRYPAASDPLSD